MEQSNRERIEEDLWNGGGSSGTVTIPKKASEGMLALFDFVSMHIPHGEQMMMDFITDVAVALDNFDPTPYEWSSDGRPMDRSEFSYERKGGYTNENQPNPNDELGHFSPS